MSSDDPGSTETSADTTNAASSNQGIDIQQALNILASRTSHDQSHSHLHEQTGCQQSATDESKAMGQTIDLNAYAETSPDPEAAAKIMEEQKEQLDRDRKARKEEIREHLQTMSVKDLLQAVMEAQRERVATYRTYDRYRDVFFPYRRNATFVVFSELCLTRFCTPH